MWICIKCTNFSLKTISANSMIMANNCFARKNSIQSKRTYSEERKRKGRIYYSKHYFPSTIIATTKWLNRFLILCHIQFLFTASLPHCFLALSSSTCKERGKDFYENLCLDIFSFKNILSSYNDIVLILWKQINFSFSLKLITICRREFKNNLSEHSKYLGFLKYTKTTFSFNSFLTFFEYCFMNSEKDEGHSRIYVFSLKN